MFSTRPGKDFTRSRKFPAERIISFLVTALKSGKLDSFCDEVIEVAARENLSGGKSISPQFPLLLFSDIIYAYYLSVETVHKELLHKYTLDILEFSKR